MHAIIGLSSIEYEIDMKGEGRLGFVKEDDKSLLETNPTKKIGKCGIGFYSEGNARKTIHIKTKEAYTAREKSYFLNKKSAITWLNSQLPKEGELSYNSRAKEVVKKINDLPSLLFLRREKKYQAQKKKYAIDDGNIYTATYCSRPLEWPNSHIDVSYWLNTAQSSNRSWSAMGLRLYKETEQKAAEGSHILAVAAYKQALSVPAYQTLLKRSEKAMTFNALPITSKENYIKPALKIDAHASLYVNGIIPLKVKRDTSTGTSGPSTPWYRGVEEQRHVEQMTMFAAKAVLGDNVDYTFINGFAMGPWATGVTATLAMINNDSASVAVVGPNINEISNCIKEQVSIRGKDHPIIVAGYPPHIRAVVEQCVREKFPMQNFNLIAVVGGESMSEDLRDLIVEQKNPQGEILRCGFKKCLSSYGASDLDINIGYESDFEVELRKTCLKNAVLAEDLFGKNNFVPMIFHYDPLNYLIEMDPRGNLLFTCVRLDRISPRVRYDLGDMGKVVPVSEILATLKKHGVNLKNPPRTQFPLLFVWGRQGSHISFRGSKVAPENLGDALSLLDKEKYPDLSKKISHFGFYQHDAVRKSTEIFIEFGEEKEYRAIDEKFLDDLLNALEKVNVDFHSQMIACPQDEKPKLRVFKPGMSPMALQEALYPNRKKQYIFKEGDEFISTHTDLQANSKLISPTKRIVASIPSRMNMLKPS